MLQSGIAAAPNSVARIFDVLGTDEFELGILRYLNAGFGVDHYTVYRMRNAVPEVVGGASTRGRHVLFPQGVESLAAQSRRQFYDLDAAREVADATGGAVILHVDIEETAEADLREAFARYGVVDRVLIAGLRGDDWSLVSLLRSRPSSAYGQRELSGLADVADLLISAFAKHASLYADRGHAAKLFQSVEMIQARLQNAGLGLTARELQVCARILYGQLTGGIALELEVGEETVATYRKRAYQRLGIGSRHELFQLYLSLA